MEFEGLSRLEDIVGRLLSQYAELKVQNELLVAEVEEKKQELGRLHGKILEMHNDKDEIHHRVSSILTKLEEWELVKHEDGSAVEDSHPDAPVTQDAQKHLFNMGV
ncbi:MAG: cell division protein ZapB [Proteobacteria bacterium]|nr:cell division protein ZapB [Pseudomonadota bacterium]MBU1638841.1 cell division protein ZapB [Pseudomonadota bacterium]